MKGVLFVEIRECACDDNGDLGLLNVADYRFVSGMGKDYRFVRRMGGTLHKMSRSISKDFGREMERDEK